MMWLFLRDAMRERTLDDIGQITLPWQFANIIVGRGATTCDKKVSTQLLKYRDQTTESRHGYRYDYPRRPGLDGKSDWT